MLSLRPVAITSIQTLMGRAILEGSGRVWIGPFRSSSRFDAHGVDNDSEGVRSAMAETGLDGLDLLCFNPPRCFPSPAWDQTIPAAMDVAAVRAAAFAALVEGALRAMSPSKLRAFAAFAAVSLTLIVTSLFTVSAWWRPLRSDQGPTPAKARGGKRVDARAGAGRIPDESAGAPVFTVKKSVYHRTTTRPGTVQPSQVVDLYPKISGELRSLSVEHRRPGPARPGGGRDRRARAACRGEEGPGDGRAGQARARRVAIAIRVAEATYLSERAKVDIAAAELKGSQALRLRREMERKRLKDLADRKTLERRLIEEEDKWLESAQEAMMAKTAQLTVARADVQAAEARLESARAESEEAQAEVRVAEANQANPEILSVAARVIVPIDGIVTDRNDHVGEVVRPASAGGSSPLLTIVQASRVRVVVEVPDCDAVLLDKGDPAIFRPHALPDRVYEGTISRTAVAEEEGTLRAEIDLDNSDGRLRPGQAGQVTIALEDHPDALVIPVTAILRDGDGREARSSCSCYRITDGRAVRTPIRNPPVESGRRHGRGARGLVRGGYDRAGLEERRGRGPRQRPRGGNHPGSTIVGVPDLPIVGRGPYRSSSVRPAARNDGPLGADAEIPIAVNGDRDRPRGVGMRADVMRPTDVVKGPAARFQHLTPSLT